MTPQRILPRDLTGMKFGRLTAVAFSHKSRNVACWKCVCECGGTAICTNANLFRGTSKSCGCWQRDRASECNRKHGMSTRDENQHWKNKTYQTWVAMRERCNNPNTKEYKNYGGRGIKVCPEWNDFAVFLRDMGDRPPGKSIDRYPDNDGDYKPVNTRWASPVQQRENQRKRTHCKRGHLYTGLLTRQGFQVCGICSQVQKDRVRILRKQKRLEKKLNACI